VKKGRVIEMRIAILGAGNIGGTMARTINGMKNVQCYAVASRDLRKAEEFAKNYGVEKAYGSYEEMLMDPLVELVYVATPHSHHYEHMKLCITHKKPILCEKAFTANATQAQEVFELAKKEQVFVTEAMWTRFVPMRKILDGILASDIIGEPTMLTANLGYISSQKERIAEPALAGGALLDIGIYPLTFAMMAFGCSVEKILSTATISQKGVDEQDSMTILYRDGKMAVLHATTRALTDRMGIISGSKGYLVVENINNPEVIRIYNTNREEIQTIKAPEQITGFEYQVLASMKAISEGKLECEEMPHEESLRMLSYMDEMRACWGVRYPFET
jgi:predicted dehydrogenase